MKRITILEKKLSGIKKKQAELMVSDFPIEEQYKEMTSLMRKELDLQKELDALNLKQMEVTYTIVPCTTKEN